MSDLLRSLHPAQEAEQYEILSLWALYPDANPVRPHVEPPGLPDYSALSPAATRLRWCPSETALAAWLTDEPRTVSEAMADVGVCYKTARSVLIALAHQGKAVKSWTTRRDRFGRTLLVVRYARPAPTRAEA